MNKKTYMETDESGEHKVIEQSNGIKIKFLRKPSEKYIKKKEKLYKIETEKRKKEEIKYKKEKLIKNKMRELAIKELEKEGKI